MSEVRDSAMLAIGVLDVVEGDGLPVGGLEKDDRVGSSGAGTIDTLDDEVPEPDDVPGDPLAVVCSGDGSLVC